MSNKHPLADCDNCPLVGAKMCPTSGPDNAKVAFVSRSPGKHDVRAGKPFAGPSGRVLDHLLKRYGVNRDDIITTNVVLCQTDDPPKAAIAACKNRLESEISNADLLIAGGTEAVSALTSYRTIANSRGFSISRTSPVSNQEQRVIATNNPAAVMRDSDQYPNMVADFKRAFDPPPPPIFPKVEIVDDPNLGRQILDKWMGTSFDYLASDLEWSGDEIYCAGFSRDGEKAVVFGRRCFGDADFKDRLRSFYERSDIRFIWHNGKSDTTTLIANGIRGRIDEDTFAQSYVLDERPGYHSLEYLLSDKFGWPDYEPQSVKNFKKKGTLDEPANRSARELYLYNGWDTAGTLQLYNLLAPLVKAEGLEDLYKSYMPVFTAYRQVELNGFRFDAEEAANINEREIYPRLFSLISELQGISGFSLLNPRSSKQLQGVYYEHFGLQHGLRNTGKKKLKTSTGKEVREEIRDGRFTCKTKYKDALVTFAAAHQRFAKIDKIRNGFIEPLAKKSWENPNALIHSYFNPCGTVTGRTSSKAPNLQNIARDQIEGESIPGVRTLFLPSADDRVIISADYSQAELRTMAKLSGERNLLVIYRDSSRSLHKERALAFYGPDYTKEQYVRSKNINFGVSYWQSAKAFAQMYHMPEEEAQNYIDSWWNEFPQLHAWTKETAAKAVRDGYVQSPFGHKRRFWLITDENIGDVQREAINFKPQNIAGWLTVLSLVELVDYGVRVVASVHDSIVADVPIPEAHVVAELMRSTMEQKPVKELGWAYDDIPYKVDVSVGPNWGTLVDMPTNSDGSFSPLDASLETVGLAA